MDHVCKILLADRNRHVRKYLERELAGEGYQVVLAGEGQELLQLLACQDPPDLLILDPDIPSYLTAPELIRLLHCRHPAVPVVIHSFMPDADNYSEIPGVEVCLEKSEDVTLLKKVIADLIQDSTGKGYSKRMSNSSFSRPP